MRRFLEHSWLKQAETKAAERFGRCTRRPTWRTRGLAPVLDHVLSLEPAAMGHQPLPLRQVPSDRDANLNGVCFFEGRGSVLRLLVLQPCGLDMVAGTLRTAPPTETGTDRSRCRTILLCPGRDGLFRACLVGIEEVTSVAVAFDSEPTFAISMEILADTFFTPSCSSGM